MDFRRRGSTAGSGAKDMFPPGVLATELELGVLRMDVRVGVSREVEVDAERQDSADAEREDLDDSVRRLTAGASEVTTTVAMPGDSEDARWRSMPTSERIGLAGSLVAVAPERLGY